MRILLAALSILLGAVALVVGIGQRTFWAPPETATASVAAPLEDAPLTVIEPSVADVHESPVQVTIEGEGEFTVALGRSSDVEAWVADAAHNTVTGVDTENDVLFAEHVDGAAEVPNPAGSDLWVATETAEGSMVHQWTEPAEGDWSLLVAADGKAPAPASVTVSWPNDTATPFAIPLIILGSLLLVFGLALLVVSSRRGRGGAGGSGSPTAAHPVVAPPTAAQPTVDGGSTQAGRKPGANTARRTAAVAAAAVLALAPAGPATAAPASPSASPSSGPSEPASSDPAATESAASQPAVEGTPVLLDLQLERILDSVAATVEAGDAARDAGKLKPRVAEQALGLRNDNYAQRAKGLDVAAPATVAAGPVLSAAVTSTPEWPRTLMAVTKAEKAKVPQVLVLRQDNPRSNYRLVSAVAMLPGSEFPGIQAMDPAVKSLPLDAGGLKAKPQQGAEMLASFLTNKGADSKDAFEKSVFITANHKGQEDVSKANKDANVKYARKVDAKRTTALSTPDGGALVSTYLRNTMTATPKEEGGTVRLDELSAGLAGASTTREGVDITYGESVVFYVPPAGGEKKMRLIAGDVVLLGAKLK